MNYNFEKYLKLIFFLSIGIELEQNEQILIYKYVGMLMLFVFQFHRCQFSGKNVYVCNFKFNRVVQTRFSLDLEHFLLYAVSFTFKNVLKCSKILE